MIIGYNCLHEHTLKELDTNANSAPIKCPDCGGDLKPIKGNKFGDGMIFKIGFGRGETIDGYIGVSAVSLEEAFEKAYPKVPDKRTIIEISRITDSD